MIGAAAAEKMYDAASKGDLTAFGEVVKNDGYLLQEATFSCSRNLLHIATMRGQAVIVKEVLKMNPRLARSLDSQNSSPLHIAAAEGNFEITKELLSVAPEMCWSRDCQNMNPIHIAAIDGHVEILKELLRIDHLAAMERVYRGQTVLHLCVKHRQLEAFKVLMEKLDELVNAKDEDGKTILDWAASTKQHEMIQYMPQDKQIEEQTTRSKDKTSPPILKESSDIRASNFRNLMTVNTKMSDTAMVVVVLIATMAFQAALSPPGGVWQDDSSSHKAGKSVMSSTHPYFFKHFVRANTTAFISSIITIFLLTTRLPYINLFFFVICKSTMLVSLTSITVSYGASVKMITPNTETQSFQQVIWIVVFVSLTIFLILNFLGQLLFLGWCRIFDIERIGEKVHP